MISKERLQQQDKLTLLNTTSLRLIPVLAEKSDMDGLLHFSIDEIKEQGYMTPKLVPAAIEGLLNIGWIRRGSDGKLYSNYTCQTTPENTGFYYINLFKLFQKDVFKKMYKRRINLLYYILTAKVPGMWHSVAIEKLYKNKTFADNLAIHYFDDFDDLMNNLLPLIEANIIEVRLGNSKVAFTYKTTHLKEKIYAFCGKENSSTRKKRIGRTINTHKLNIRIANEVLKDKTTIYDIDRHSTLRDLEMIAEEYDYNINMFTEDALKEVHMVKHKIHKEFGNLGIAIYRESIRSFFEHSSHSFGPLMEKQKFGKVIKSHYVVPRIKIELTNAVKEAEKTQELSKTEAFLRYFTKEAYLDDLVLFDDTMNTTFSNVYETAKHKNVTWKQFADKVEHIYQEEASRGNSSDLVMELALKGELTSKKRIEEELKQKQDIEKQKRKVQQKTGYNSSRHEVPEEVRAYKEHLRAKGYLKADIREIECDF